MSIVDRTWISEVHSRLAAHGYAFGHTGGNCTAFIRVCPDGSEIWVTLADGDGYPDPSAPEDLDDCIVVGTYPVGDDGQPVEAVRATTGTAPLATTSRCSTPVRTVLGTSGGAS